MEQSDAIDQRGVAAAEQAIAQIRAEVFASLQVPRQRPGCFSQGDGVKQIAGGKTVHQQVEVGMVAEAFTQDGAEQVDGANVWPCLPERISSRLGLVQPGLAPLLQLRGIGCEALSPVVLRVNGRVLILTSFVALEAWVTAPGLVETQS